MAVRNRVKELRWVRAQDVHPHPRNWRTHPQFQRQALRAVLQEVGFADALIARELPDGSLQLIDGHLRAEILPDERLPVLVLDVDEHEADKLLASLDPLTALAECNAEAVATLVARVSSESEALQAVFDNIRRAPDQDQPIEPGDESTRPTAAPTVVAESFQIVVECRDETDQRTLFERLSGEGYRCRVLTL